MAGPGIEPRTSDLRVRFPTDCAKRPGSLGVGAFIRVGTFTGIVRNKAVLQMRRVKGIN